jgi:maltose-binding protein MalE
LKKVFALILLASLILTAFASCNNSTNENTGTSTTGSQSQTETTTQKTTDIFDGLEVKTYDDRDFNILSRQSQVKQFIAEEGTGDVLSDAVYQRNLTVEERFGVKINVIPVAGDWNDRTSFMNSLRNSVMAGDGAYDLVDGYAAYIGDLLGSKLYLNLLEVPHLRLTEPWWSQLAVEELTVGGKLYVVPGDITTNLWANIQIIFFNKDLLENLGLDSPYPLVKSGDWTLDKMTEMSKGLAVDLNGDGIMGIEDQFGTFFTETLQLNNFHNAFNIPVTKKDSSGIPHFNLGSPEVANLAEKIYQLAYSGDGVLLELALSGDGKSIAGSVEEVANIAEKMFLNNQILFLPCMLEVAEKLRAAETDFGILPYPKQTKEQAEYRTSSRDGHTMFGIPIDVKDADFSGRITEALCAASNKTVVPAYYDIALKNKFLRDEESAEMLDIIRNGLNFDFGIVFSMQLSRAGFIIRDCLEYRRGFTSEYEKNVNVYDAALEEFLEAYK